MSSILISNHEEFAKLCPTSLPVPVFYYRRIMTGVTFNSLGVLLLICKFSVKICNAQQKLIIQTICLKKLFFNISTHIFNKQLHMNILHDLIVFDDGDGFYYTFSGKHVNISIFSRHNF